MQDRPFGLTGMRVAPLALGAMTFPNRLPIDEAGRVLDQAIDHGVNLIDTADSYGESETVLGRLLQSRDRERVYLATKVFRRFARVAGVNPGNGRVARNSRVNILSSLERSLRLLNTDYVDLYQLHHPDPDTPIQETLDVLDTIVRQGKARYVGVSNHYGWQMGYMLGLSAGGRHVPMVSYQCCYSALDRVIENEAVPMIQKLEVATMIYSPLCGGLLSGLHQRSTGAAAGTRVAQFKSIHNRLDDAMFDTLEALEKLAADHHLTLPQLSILWLLAKPWVTTVLLGGSKAEHYTTIYDLADRTLDPQAVAEVDRLTEAHRLREYMNQSQRDAPRMRPG